MEHSKTVSSGLKRRKERPHWSAYKDGLEKSVGKRYVAEEVGWSDSRDILEWKLGTGKFSRDHLHLFIDTT